MSYRVVEVDTHDLRFTQDSIKNCFQYPHDHFSIRDAVRGISMGNLDSGDFPMIRVKSSGGNLWSFDNRRLWVFRMARCSHVKVKMVTKSHPRVDAIIFNPWKLAELQGAEYFPRVRGADDLLFDIEFPIPRCSEVGDFRPQLSSTCNLRDQTTTQSGFYTCSLDDRKIMSNEEGSSEILRVDIDDHKIFPRRGQSAEVFGAYVNDRKTESKLEKSAEVSWVDINDHKTEPILERPAEISCVDIDAGTKKRGLQAPEDTRVDIDDGKMELSLKQSAGVSGVNINDCKTEPKLINSVEVSWVDIEERKKVPDLEVSEDLRVDIDNDEPKMVPVLEGSSGMSRVGFVDRIIRATFTFLMSIYENSLRVMQGFLSFLNSTFP